MRPGPRLRTVKCEVDGEGEVREAVSGLGVRRGEADRERGDLVL